MANYFKLDGEETDRFVEEIRAQQMELMIKWFLVYYEQNKSEAELKYLEKIADGFDKDFKTYFKKFTDLFAAEGENNPELISFISERMLSHISNLIYAFVEDKDEQVIREILESVFENDDLVKTMQQYES